MVKPENSNQTSITTYYLLVFMTVLFSGGSLASIPKESESSEPAHSFHFAIEEELVVKETASLIRKGLEDLGAGTIWGIFSGKRSFQGENMKQPVWLFVGTAGECFLYDSVTRETVMCEEKLLISQELLSGSLAYAPVSFSQEKALQVAGLGDWICSHKTEIIIATLTAGAIAGILAGTGAGVTLSALSALRSGTAYGAGLKEGIETGMVQLSTIMATTGATTTGVLLAIGGEEATAGGAATAGATVGAGIVTATILGVGAGIAGIAATAGATVGAGAIAGAVYYFCPAKG